MSQVIRISDELYKRLEAYATGFDSPSNVIESILNAFEDQNPDSKPHLDTNERAQLTPAARLEIHYFSGSEEKFKQQLLKSKRAYIKLYYTDGTSELKEWNAHRFSHSSSVDGNLRSGYLRGWRKRGIFKAELSVHRHEIS